MSQIPSGLKGPEDYVIDQDLKTSLQKTLEDLRVEDRETIMISVLGGQKPDVPAATFRKRLQRSLSALKSAWRAEHGND